MKTYFASRRIWTAALLAAGLLAGASLAAADRREGEPFHWNGRMAAGSTLEIHGVNGQIEVAPSSGGEAQVDAEKWSRHSDPDRVRIGIERGRDVVVIRAIYPRHWFGMDNDDVNVHFTVRVPPKVEVRLTTVNGSVEAMGLENRVVARTVNGGIRIDTAREAEARTVNGSITVRSNPRAGELHFRSINGSVRLEIPSQASVRVSARTLNGAIECDLPTGSLRSGFIGRSYHGTVGRGDADLSVSTINGSIHVTRI